MNEEDVTKTPSEELAENIAKALSQEGLLDEVDAGRISATISSGKTKAEDWRLAIEKVIDREKEDE